MNNGHRAIVAMLAVVAALLVVNIVQGPRAAEAQEVGRDGGPYVVDSLMSGWERYYRVWSDGRVDLLERPGETCGYTPVFSAGPVEHPFAVVDAVMAQRNPPAGVKITFEDGRVDLVAMWAVGGPNRCTVAPQYIGK